MDVRFAVNTLAPYWLTKRLLPIIPQQSGRVINLSSAAQMPVHLPSMIPGRGGSMDASHAYAQSKLAIATWSIALSKQYSQTIVALNPASLIGTKMVREGYGIPGKSLSIGANILLDAALSKKFGSQASGKYFDNDVGDFSRPHHDATNAKKQEQLLATMDQILADVGLALPSTTDS